MPAAGKYFKQENIQLHTALALSLPLLFTLTQTHCQFLTYQQQWWTRIKTSGWKLIIGPQRPESEKTCLVWSTTIVCACVFSSLSDFIDKQRMGLTTRDTLATTEGGRKQRHRWVKFSDWFHTFLQYSFCLQHKLNSVTVINSHGACSFLLYICKSQHLPLDMHKIKKGKKSCKRDMTPAFTKYKKYW